MQCFCDLHMHSCLSPCGDELMTPNNIVKMAALKGLHMIALCDHNTARHVPAVAKIAADYDLAVLPGIELTTREEVHLLAYFRTVEELIAFSDKIYSYLPNIPNRPDYFGAQQILDENDEPIGEEPKLLITALDLSLDELVEMIRARGGIAVPAHINRSGNGILSVLGFLPPNLGFKVIEVSHGVTCPPGYEGHGRLVSSDAHYIMDMLERVEALELSAPTPDAFFDWVQQHYDS